MKNLIKLSFLQNITVLVIVLIFLPVIRTGLVKVDTAFERIVAVGVVLLLTMLLTKIAEHYYLKWWSDYQKNTPV